MVRVGSRLLLSSLVAITIACGDTSVGTESAVERAPLAIDDLVGEMRDICLLYTSPSPRDLSTSRMPSSA